MDFLWQLFDSNEINAPWRNPTDAGVHSLKQQQKHIEHIETLLAMIAIDCCHGKCLRDLSLLSAHASTRYVRSLSNPLILAKPRHLLRLHSRQRHNTIHYILERLLVLLRKFPSQCRSF